MSPAASDVKVSQAEGTMELRQNVNLSARARFCVFFLCVCVIVWARVYLFSRVIKDPICHTLPRTHTQSPYEPLQRN